MARQNPIPEVDRQIGERLRKFRIEQTGLSAVEFARRMGIDSNRLATYEHGRAPLRYEIADKAAKEFNISQRWLAEGIEPIRWYVSIPQALQEIIPKRSIFSDAYEPFLKPHVEMTLAELANFWGVAQTDMGLDAAQYLAETNTTGVSNLDLLNILHRNLVRHVGEIPPDLYQKFFSQIITSCRKFQEANAKRIGEWKQTPRVHIPPTWVAQAKKSSLTKEAESLTSDPVQPVLPKLIQRLQRATAERGSKSELAKWLGVHRQSVTDWLSGKQEPGGEITLRLLHWVEQRECQKQKL